MDGVSKREFQGRCCGTYHQINLGEEGVSLIQPFAGVAFSVSSGVNVFSEFESLRFRSCVEKVEECARRYRDAPKFVSRPLRQYRIDGEYYCGSRDGGDEPIERLDYHQVASHFEY